MRNIENERSGNFPMTDRDTLIAELNGALRTSVTSWPIQQVFVCRLCRASMDNMREVQHRPSCAVFKLLTLVREDGPQQALLAWKAWMDNKGWADPMKQGADFDREMTERQRLLEHAKALTVTALQESQSDGPHHEQDRPEKDSE
jgi:hypothetical protein